MELRQRHHLIALIAITLALLIGNFAAYKLPVGIKIQHLTIRYDYLLHVFAFLLFSLALYGTLPKRWHRVWVISLVTGSIISFSLVLELLQRLVPGRNFNSTDVLCNAVGVAIGLLIWAVYKRRFSC